MCLRRFFFLAAAVAFIFSVVNSRAAETYTVFGKIIDKETGKPVPGATIRIENSNKGTYSSSAGKFRLPFLEGSKSLKISSIGYHSTTVNISANDKDTLLVRLLPDDVKSKGVEVIGNIEVNEVIRRAISKKEENQKKLKTFEGTLYSKLAFELAGSALSNAEATANSISIGAGSGRKENTEKYKMFVLETFSHVANDFDKHIESVSILQRRQTANLQPQNNLLSMGTFISFYNDQIKMLNANMVTPLATDALSYYNYELKEKNILDDRYIYVIDVKPKSEIYPLFEGTIKIVEGTYELTEVDLKPSASTAISFVKNLHFNQKFMEVKKDLWVPSYLEITANAAVEVLKGFMDLDMDINATSIYSDIKANEPLPDSIYVQNTPRIVSVLPSADSTKSEFWEKNSLREISDRELEMYRKVDSLVAIDTSANAGSGKFHFNIMPDIGFNRVSSAALGASIEFGFPFINNNLTFDYSFGLKSVLKTYEFTLPIFYGFGGSLGYYNISLLGSLYDKLANTAGPESYHRLLNTFTAALFHEDYYDYYRSEGGSLGFRANAGRLEFTAIADYSKQSSTGRTTPRSSISIIRDDMRPNPAIDDGKYISLRSELSYSSSISIGEDRSIDYNIDLSGKYGEKYKEGSPFRLAEGYISASIPTFSTGYSPMMLNLMLQGGTSSGSLPVQEQFRQKTRLLVFTGSGAFFSAPLGWYGGTEYFAGHFSYNITDIWWRAIGLPLYEGRGIDLILAGSSGKYFSTLNKIYAPTAPDFYSEVGFGLSRIPTFISNVGYLAFDARWGVGPLGKGRFGWGLSVTLPF